jgi:hypothetical protein
MLIVATEMLKWKVERVPDDESVANASMVMPANFRAVEHLIESITQYWVLECAEPELEAA